MQPVIRFENVGKLYRLGTVGTGTLSHDIRRWWITSVMRKEDPYLKIGETNDRSTKGSSDYVYALKDINLEVQEGDVLGIIGKNGAGKSTLLKLLSRVTAPTTGKIHIRGRIASLLEVGTGFHPELTGRENIYMNGSILGMKKNEIDRKLDEIIDFSGCERYIDTPVKRYSSGMMVRLGFAVAAHLDPEILVVDEVLAVGDAEFQKKAIGKMQDVSKGQGRTVLFVSHNRSAVRQLCRTGLVLENGKIEMFGISNDAVNFYINNNLSSKTPNFVKITDNYRDKGLLGNVVFESFLLNKESGSFMSTELIVFHIKLHANKTCFDCRINCTIYDREKNPIGSVVSFNGFKILKNEDKMVEYTINNPGLAPGTYTISVSIGTGDITSGLTLYDAVRDFITFDIDRASNNKFFAVWSKTWGNIYLQSTTKVI